MWRWRFNGRNLLRTLKLSHLIAIYDSNQVSLDGKTDNTFTEDVQARFQAMNWNVLNVSDGEDIISIDEAISKAKTTTDKPTLIIVKTVLGKHSKNQGTNKVHGFPLDKEDITSIKEKLGFRDIPFAISQESIDLMRNMVNDRCIPLYEESNKVLNKLSEEEKLEFDTLNNNIIINDDIDYETPEDKKEALRVTGSKILNQFTSKSNFIMGGSSDLSSSTKTYIDNGGDFSSTNRSGKNILFGVREHAMGAILNGIALSGIKTFGSTFLAFSDYLKPAIRMSALMKLPVNYIFTHDSISLGEDGPTHQPVEQLISLRSIPNIEVFRPCDVNEIIGIYQYIMTKTDSPSVITLSRNDVNIKENTSIKEAIKGGYIIKKEEKNLSGIIIASGEEVDTALEVAKNLEEKGFELRVVSMPSIELFNKQDQEYKEELLPLGVKTFVIEASSSYSWYKFVYNDKYLITLDEFGTSASKDDIYNKYGFDIESITTKIEELLK